MPRTPEQYEQIRNEKKEQIKRAALELFAVEGFHATSISKIATKANISKGLLYNYFESKTHLLEEIIHTFSHEILDMLNPDHDDTITLEEAKGFIDEYFKMLKEKRDEIKLLFQLTVQPSVIDTIMDTKLNQEALENQKLFMNFFIQNSPEEPEIAMITLTSLLKGFSLQYVYAPEMFPDELIAKFKTYLLNTFTK